MKTFRTILYTFLLLFFAFSPILRANDDNPTTPVTKVIKTFSKEDISKIADAYVNNNTNIENAAFVDVDGDGIFDMLVFKKGNVEYYRNIGSLETPYFALENSHYDKYDNPLLTRMPMPIFFADTKGKGVLDMFAIEKLDFNSQTNKYEYRVLYSENVFGLSTGTLIAIILVLIIIVLVIAIIH